MAMAVRFYLSVALILSLCSTGKCGDVPNGVLDMECHERYFMIAVDLSFAGDDLRFEAVDQTGAYPITNDYGAKCGYSIGVHPLPGHVELRASYFSCHTDNRDDEVFTFNFNLLVTHMGQEFAYALNKTCSLTLAWSPREVTCEARYMEVSVKSEVTCPSGTRKDDWNDLKSAHGSTTSDWQVMFQRDQEQSPPINLTEAREQGYVFDLTDGRLVFRTPYGQPDSFSTMVNGVPVEVIHATLFSRQSWVVLMVDLVAACSINKGSYDENGYVVLETPEVLYPGLDIEHVRLGLSPELFPLAVAEDKGYILVKHNKTIQIGIPYNAEGGHRKSFVTGDLFEYYVFHLYLEQILAEDNMQTRIRHHRTLATPLLPRPIFAENQTVFEERVFTIYLGDIPVDVELVAVLLNGQEFAVPFVNVSTLEMSKVLQPNNTHGFILKVPFDDPVVTQQFSKKDATMQHLLDINYTLTVLPENEPYYYSTSVVALTDVSPPVFDAVCMESGIIFSVEYRPFDDLWYVSIGSEPLTSDLASRHGYIVTNDSRSLQLEVPLFTHGYKYKDITLRGFFGTFEILVRDRETSEVQSSTIKTCPFSATEMIMCSTDGKMTVVADLTHVIPPNGISTRTSLRDKYCGPKETDGTWGLFSVPLNSCGSIVKLEKETVSYHNEILYTKKFTSSKTTSDNTTDRVMVQCTYPVAGLHRLFSAYKFESDEAGYGSIIHTIRPTAGPKPTTALQTVPLITRPTRGPVQMHRPAHHPPAQSIRVHPFRGIIKSPGGASQVKVNSVQLY